MHTKDHALTLADVFLTRDYHIPEIVAALRRSPNGVVIEDAKQRTGWQLLQVCADDALTVAHALHQVGLSDLARRFEAIERLCRSALQWPRYRLDDLLRRMIQLTDHADGDYALASGFSAARPLVTTSF